MLADENGLRVAQPYQPGYNPGYGGGAYKP